MSTNPKDNTKAPGHLGNRGRQPRRNHTLDKEERYQRTRERIPDDDNPTSEAVEPNI